MYFSYSNTKQEQMKQALVIIEIFAMFQYRIIIKYSVIWVSVYGKYYEWNDAKGALFLFQWLHRDVII